MIRIGLIALLAIAGCRAAPARLPAPVAPPPAPPAPNAADARFMTEMIAHHEQAVLMAGWALDLRRGASPTLRVLAERIRVAQEDEIAIMRRWLRERGLAAPEPDPDHAAMSHGPDVPGMLTPVQLDSLDAARATAFDRLFVQYMIQHHQGAVAMVDRLLATEGAAQGGLVFRIAADVSADQTAEINRMRRMLAAMP